ncbi:hypothetical protein ACJJTC_002784 [Scirpophaga incertulas]
MMKEDYATAKQVDQLKNEVQHLSSGCCNVNPSRGAYVARLSNYECDSGPMGLTLECKCLSEMSAIVESQDVETVFMVGDYNAHLSSSSPSHECLSEMSAIVESQDVETVFMVGDYNAHLSSSSPSHGISPVSSSSTKQDKVRRDERRLTTTVKKGAYCFFLICRRVQNFN